MGLGVIDIDNHECMTLGSIQTPDCKTLDNMDKNLVDWYNSYLISRKDKLHHGCLRCRQLVRAESPRRVKQI